MREETVLKVATPPTRIYEVRFDATINRGNYESEKIGFSCYVNEDDSVDSVLSWLKNKAYGRDTSNFPTERKTKNEVIPEQYADDKKVEASLKQQSEDREVAKESAPVEEPKAKKAKKDKPVSAPTEEKAEEQTPAKKAATKGATPYQRNLDLHKKLLGQHLDAVFPSWRKDIPLKEKCRAVSEKLDGVDFLDSEGMVLQEFKDQFKSTLESLK